MASTTPEKYVLIPSQIMEIPFLIPSQIRERSVPSWVKFPVTRSMIIKTAPKKMDLITSQTPWKIILIPSQT